MQKLNVITKPATEVVENKTLTISAFNADGTPAPRCLATAEAGLSNSDNITVFLSQMVSDLAAQRLPAVTGNAMCNGIGKMLKLAEMRYKYGNRMPPPIQLAVLSE